MESSCKSWLLCSILVLVAFSLGTYFGLRRRRLPRPLSGKGRYVIVKERNANEGLKTLLTLLTVS
uniref:GH10531p n=1 Tax=Drosophila melanogaster TaxID=7227 RepID=Q9VZC4_DROME|eukprot:NP_728994.1 nicotinic acetylcholine receptor beta1, isoform B [Drosophila melanogaster]